MSRPDTSLSNAATGDAPTSSVPPQVDESDNGASLLIESPVTYPGQHAGEPKAPPKRHDFPDGGGSGGAEAFRRSNMGNDTPGHGNQ
ncbi:MAG: hypothetical protein EOO28_00485 [Comamonadaceae bacterium]|nr:MAG: hypothetical protein EOO28_00485 [Comamonadaceae bacterium]